MSFWDKPRQSGLRKALFQVHLWSGIAIGLYVIIVALTGSILVYRYEIEHAIAPGLNRIAPSAGKADLQAVYENLRQRYPHLNFQQLAVPDSPNRAWFWRTRDQDNNRVYLYFHPNTGVFLGAEEHRFLWMQWIYDLHAYLLFGKPGLVPNGIGGALLTALCVSGLIIWWPGIRNWRFGFRYAGAAGWKRQNYDLHKLTGIASFVVLAVIALSGVYYCFPTQSRSLIAWVSGHPMLVDPVLTGQPQPKQWANLNLVYAEAEKALPGGRVWALSLPQRPDSPFTYRKIYPGDWHRAGDHWVFLDAGSAKPIRWEKTGDFPWGTRLIKSMAPLHFGTWGGHASRVLYIALGVGASVLAITGYLMYWNRILSKRLQKLQWGRPRKMETVQLPVSKRTIWDQLGMWLSYGCAVHCAAMPFVIGYLSLNGMGWIAEEATEWTIIAASLSIGLFRLFYSYFKEHRQPEPIVYFLLGVGFIMLAKSVFIETPEQFEPVGMVAGGLFIGTAHFRNQSKCKCCQQPLVGTSSNG